MELFNYQHLWVAYSIALCVLGISGYLIVRPIPYRWIKWNLFVAIIVFLASPIQTEDHWMIPSALYILFEYFFIGNTSVIDQFYELLTHVGIACIATSLMLFSIHLMSNQKTPKKPKTT